MIVVGGVGYSIHKMDGLAFRKSNNLLERGASPFGWHYFNNETCLKRYPFGNDFAHWFCVISRDENPTLLLFGNSFANQLYPGLANNTNLQHQTILSIGVCNAEEPAGEDEPDFVKNPSNPCASANKLRQQNFIDNIVKQSGSIKFAIVDGLTTNPSQNYFLRLKNRIDFLESNNIKVIVFTPHLRFDRDIRACIARVFHAPENCEMDIGKRTKITDDFAPLIRQLSKSNPNVVYFDQNDLFCDKEKCSAVRDGMPLYRDSGHISEYGSVELSKIFVNWARTNVSQLVR